MPSSRIRASVPDVMTRAASIIKMGSTLAHAWLLDLWVRANALALGYAMRSLSTAGLPANPAYDEATIRALRDYFATFVPAEKP
jgi:hypothetical protein